MDEGTVRQRAEGHAQATVAGDLRRAGSDLAPQAQATAREVMAAMPGSLTGADIAGVRADGDAYVVDIVYHGSSGSLTVRSRWAEIEGRPRIVALELPEA